MWDEEGKITKGEADTTFLVWTAAQDLVARRLQYWLAGKSGDLSKISGDRIGQATLEWVGVLSLHSVAG